MLKEHNTPYTITYTAPDGSTKTTGMMWADELPTEAQVALSLRDQLLGEFLITDALRSDTEDTTVRQLREAGFIIKHIIRAL